VERAVGTSYVEEMGVFGPKMGCFAQKVVFAPKNPQNGPFYPKPPIPSSKLIIYY
jgi:hypothetical protein